MSAQPHKLPSAWVLLTISTDAVRKNLKLFILLSSVTIVSTLISVGQQIQHSDAIFSWKGVATSSLFGPDFNNSNITGMATLVAVLSLVGFVFSLMKYILTLRAAQGKVVSFDELWRDFVRNWLWFRLLLLIICLAISLIIGLILLVVPGIIIIWRFSMAPYLMIDKGTNISESFAQSWEITKGHAWDIYSIVILGAVLALPSAIPFVGPLIAIATTLAYSCAMPLRYEQIKHRPRTRART